MKLLLTTHTSKSFVNTGTACRTSTSVEVEIITRESSVYNSAVEVEIITRESSVYNSASRNEYGMTQQLVEVFHSCTLGFN